MLKWNLVKAGVVTLIVRGENKATKEQIPSHNKAYSRSPLYFTAISHFHPRLSCFQHLEMLVVNCHRH